MEDGAENDDASDVKNQTIEAGSARVGDEAAIKALVTTKCHS